MKNNLLPVTALILSLPCLASIARSEPARVFECQTDKHHVLVDSSSVNTFRYRVWNNPKPVEQKPDLVLIKGKKVTDGTGPCRFDEYQFSSGKYQYAVGELGCTDGSEPKDSSGHLRVSKDGEFLSQEWCRPIKNK